jgi:hypothetical protein
MASAAWRRRGPVITRRSISSRTRSLAISGGWPPGTTAEQASDPELTLTASAETADEGHFAQAPAL